MTYLSSLLIGALTFIGGLFPHTLSVQYDAGADNLHFGTVSYPTSLDSLTNPASTDSVATVSHSAQHANANDAIEALEAKVGTFSSAPVNGSLLGGTSAGVSKWLTSPTTTDMYTTHLYATASSSLNNLSFANATGTSATTTNIFSTTASTTNLAGTNITGFNLSSCTGSNALQYSSGQFNCTAISTGGPTTVSTTTAQQMATTTFRTSDGTLCTAKNNIKITFTTPNVVGDAKATANMIMQFNSDTTANYGWAKSANLGTPSFNGDQSWILFSSQNSNGASAQKVVSLEIQNYLGAPKAGFSSEVGYATTSTMGRVGRSDTDFLWESTALITQIDIGHDDVAQFGTSTQIEQMCW